MTDTSRHVVMLVRNPYTHDSRVEKEARSLVDAGYRVTVVADAAPGLPLREERDGSEVVRVPRVGPRVPGLRFVVHQWRLIGQLRARRPDILHAHDSNALLPVAVAARRLGVPYVYDAHELWLGRPHRGRSRAYAAVSQLLYTALERLTVPRATETVTVSRPIANHLKRRYRLPRVGLVPNYPALAPAARPRDLRARAGTDAAQPLVLYLGGLMSGRGLEQLVDAVALLDGVQLVLLGNGPLAGDIRLRAGRAGASDRIHFAEAVAPDDVIDYAAAADVGVSPIVPSSLNYRYSLPNKLFQYMAAAIPVVASDLPQVREVVESTGCGVVVDTTRPEAIAEGIASVLADPARARDMGERGRRAVVERYNWGVSASVLLEAYRRLERTIAAPGSARISHARRAGTDQD